MHIELLANHPDLVPIVAKWRWDEWGHNDPDGSLEIKTLEMEAYLQRDQIPLSVVALEEAQPVGVASLTFFDMHTRKDLSPWLAGVYVRPEYRSRGIASSLIEAVEEKAKEFGVEVLYLYSISAVGLYQKLGWKEFDREEYEAREVTIMKKSLKG